MQKKITLRLLPSEAADTAVVQQYIAQAVAVPAEQVSGYDVLKRSIDARGRQAWIQLTLQAFVNEPYRQPDRITIPLQDVHHAGQSVIVIGAGPAGLFA